MRAVGPGFAPFDPAFRQQQYQQQMQFLQHQRMAAAQAQQSQAPAEPNDEVKPIVEDEAPAADAEKQATDSVPAAATSPAVTVLPAKPAVTMPTLCVLPLNRVSNECMPMASHLVPTLLPLLTFRSMGMVTPEGLVGCPTSTALGPLRLGQKRSPLRGCPSLTSSPCWALPPVRKKSRFGECLVKLPLRSCKPRRLSSLSSKFHNPLRKTPR